MFFFPAKDSEICIELIPLWIIIIILLLLLLPVLLQKHHHHQIRLVYQLRQCHQGVSKKASARRGGGSTRKTSSWGDSRGK
jgi:hypothetical protein